METVMSHVDYAVLHHQAVRDRVLAQDPEIDDRTLADTLEGLTDLNEIVAALVRSALEDEALVAGLKARLSDMEARQARLVDRASKRRGIARDVMAELSIKKIVAPDFTISMRPGTPSLQVLNEKLIPSEYWEPREPRLKKAELLSELKHGAAIAGAALSNTDLVMSVRAK
jgi:hypothetical protein